MDKKETPADKTVTDLSPLCGYFFRREEIIKERLTSGTKLSIIFPENNCTDNKQRISYEPIPGAAKLSHKLSQYCYAGLSYLKRRTPLSA